MEYLDYVEELRLITHNIAVQLDKPLFHLEVVEEMCNYETVAVKIDFHTKK